MALHAAVNAIPSSGELPAFLASLRRLLDEGTDEVILNDPGVIALARRTDLTLDYATLPVSVPDGVPLAERTLPHLAGYRGMGPVRVGNQASEPGEVVGSWSIPNKLAWQALIKDFTISIDSATVTTVSLPEDVDDFLHRLGAAVDIVGIKLYGVPSAML